MDCLEGMWMIPDKSVDLIVIDPPYNIGIKGADWDKFGKEEYTDFMGNVFRECERVLKDNGSFYWFHNEMPQIAKLMTWLDDNTRFSFNSFITWDKGDWRALSWKNPSDKNNLRSWFNTAEYCLFYTFQESTGLQYIEKEYVAPRNPFRKELIRARKDAGMSITEVAGAGKFHGKINHGGAVTNWEKGYNIPLKEQWELMKTYLPINKEYEDLRMEYENLRKEFESERFTHKLDENHNNIWRYKTENRGKYHACQKPLTVIERIIKTSSNEGGIVLDCFMGSGTTAVASARLNRNFIGFERESEYVRIANQRLEAVQDVITERKLT
jgi:site-specific DNA-methyltransferase (adenine-specific)